MKIVSIPANKRNIFISVCVGIIVIATITTILLLSRKFSIPTSISKDQLLEDFKQMFIIRDKAALENNTDSIKYMFNTSVKIGRWAYEHEKNRAKYINNWAILRKAKFVSMESDIRIQRIREKGGSIWVDFLHSGKFTYVYNDIPDQPTVFGIGTRRTMELIKSENGWIIKREWYLDPFEDRLEIPKELMNDAPQTPNVPAPQVITNNENVFEMELESELESVANKTKKRYDRDKAVAYADKYCGATFGSGNDYKYNKKYRDYTGLGGDCANFTSQMLADRTEGGGLKMDGTWFYNYKYKGVGGGTQAWVRAVTLKNYLLYSGKAKQIKKGTLEQVCQIASDQKPVYSQLQKGDLICYEKDGDEHFSIVTAFDVKGWPLVNSHSTDRYKVPWDLGWCDKDTKYYLLHIKD